MHYGLRVHRPVLAELDDIGERFDPCNPETRFELCYVTSTDLTMTLFTDRTAAVEGP